MTAARRPTRPVAGRPAKGAPKARPAARSRSQAPAAAPAAPSAAHIAEPLRALAVPVESLATNPDNLRDHDERSIATLAAGLKRWGQRLPLIARRADRVVLAGNGRLRAATRLGWPTVAVVFVDDDAAAAEAFAMFDNRVAEVGTSWRFDGLAAALKASAARGEDLTWLGWDAAEAAPLLAAEFAPPAVDDDAAFAHASKLHHVVVTQEQLEVFDRAAARVRDAEGDQNIAAGRCLELICADYLAG